MKAEDWAGQPLHTKVCLFQHSNSFKWVYLLDTTYLLPKSINCCNIFRGFSINGVQSFTDLIEGDR